MSTNGHKRIGTAGAGLTARSWPCAGIGRRGFVATMAVPCPGSPSAYLLGGEAVLRQGGNSVNDPRFTDQNNQI